MRASDAGEAPELVARDVGRTRQGAPLAVEALAVPVGEEGVLDDRRRGRGPVEPDDVEVRPAGEPGRRERDDVERAGPRSAGVEEAAEERVAEGPRRPRRRDRGVEHGGRLRGEVAEPPLGEVEGELVVAEGLPLPRWRRRGRGDGAEP